MKTSETRHPTPEQLVSYRSGELDIDQEVETRNHLVSCQECCDLLLDLAALEASPLPKAEVSDLETQRAWHRLKKRLHTSRNNLHTAGWWAAAAMVLVSIGLLVKIQSLEHRMVAFYSEDLPRVIIDGKSERGIGDDSPILELLADRPGLVLLLLHSAPQNTNFEIELFSANGDLLWSRSNLSAAEDLLAITVDRNLLPEGKIRIKAYGISADSKHFIDEFGFLVRHRE